LTLFQSKAYKSLYSSSSSPSTWSSESSPGSSLAGADSSYWNEIEPP